MDLEPEPIPFVISYFTRDLAANRRFYGEFLGLSLHSEPGLEEVFFLAGTEPVRLQILTPPSGLGMADEAASSGLLLVGVDDPAILVALRERAAALGITEWRDEQQGPDNAAQFLDPDGRMVVVQLFDPGHRFHH